MSSFRGKVRLDAVQNIFRHKVEDDYFVKMFEDIAKLIRTLVKLLDPDFPEDVNYIEELLGLSFVLLQAKIRRVSEAAAKASLVRRLADLDKTQLPSVDQAKQMQRGQQPPGQTADEIRHEIRCAWQSTKTGKQFAQAIEERGLILVHVSREEAANSREEAAKAINRQNRALKEGFAVVDRRGSVYQVDQSTTGDVSNAHALEGTYKETGKSLVELIWAVGNYYKHCDEWGREVWEDKKAGEPKESNSLKQSRDTRRIIEKIGIERSSTGVSTACEFFEIEWASDCTPLANKVQEWANAVYKKYTNP